MEITEIQDDGLYSTSDVARVLKLGIENIRRKIRSGEIEAVRVGHIGPYRIRGREIKRLVESS